MKQKILRNAPPQKKIVVIIEAPIVNSKISNPYTLNFSTSIKS